MLELKTKKQLANEAHKLSGSYQLVRYRNVTYIPADFETRALGSTAPDRTIWLPMTRERVRLLARDQFDTLFASDAELTSFDFMVAQNADYIEDVVQSLLIRTDAGLRVLNNEGQLEDPTGSFMPNAVLPVLNEDQAEKDRVFDVLCQWLDSDEEAESLLCHLATCLAPGWSAVKYILLLGEGRNGKSVLLKMMHALFGRENVSSVTRQHIALQSPLVTELNGKLLNLVYDGQAEYLKDSGAEKTLIAGEPFAIRKLYESHPTLVQTNALFVEGLQTEPKSKDKSTALQKRLVRFQFPNIYPQDNAFERRMLSPASLGAFLSLLIDRYVREDDMAERLALTSKAMELQLEHMYSNSLGMQFVKYVLETDNLGLDAILGVQMSEVVQKFQSWRVKENDLSTWAEPDVEALFRTVLNTERRSMRTTSGPRKVRVVTSLKDEAAAFVESLKGTESEADDSVSAMVED